MKKLHHQNGNIKLDSYVYISKLNKGFKYTYYRLIINNVKRQFDLYSVSVYLN